MSLLSRPKPSNKIYTDAPHLHPNLIWGSLQLLFWLLIHPSAWQNYVTRLDPDLPPNFSLLELRWGQWPDPALRRFLLMSYLVWPLLLGLLVWLTGIAGASYVFEGPRGVGGGIIFAMAIYLALSLTNGLAVSVALGLVSGVVGSLAYSIASTWSTGPERDLALIIALSLALGIASSAALGVAGITPNRPKSTSTMRRVSGIVVGGVIGIVAPFSILILMVWVTQNTRFTTLLTSVANLVGAWAIFLVQGLVIGAGAGLALAIIVGRRLSWPYSLAVGLAFGLIFGPSRVVALDTMPALAGVGNVTLLGVLFGLCYTLVERIAGQRTGLVASTLGSGIGFILLGFAPSGSRLVIGLMGLLGGLTLPWWHPVIFYPGLLVWNFLLYWLDDRPLAHATSYLAWHTAFWDEQQRLPLLGLADHLLLVLSHNPAEGQAALSYLSSGSQRWAVQATQIELDARQLEGCSTVQGLSQIHQTLLASDLSGPANALLRSFNRLSQDIDFALQQESVYNQRLALYTIEERLDGLLRELTRSSEPYAERFRPITTHWREIVQAYIQQLTAQAEIRQELDNPYIIGIPLTEQQEIFIGRTQVSARIEQLLRDERRPPLFLYGQRRMGKTSLLNNLGRLLPSTIVPLFVDLQGASRATDPAGLLYNISRDMAKSASRRRNLALPALAYNDLALDPFTHFDEWLDEVEQVLQQQGHHTALLALDEVETLARAFSKGRYDEEDVLGMLRHLIQHRPCFKVLLAGSQPLAAFQRWASYLINVQVIHISYLQATEAHQLIERPVKDFALRYELAASQRVFRLTRGHPFLIQLLCAELVAYKNEQDPSLRRLASLADVEAVVPEALTSGSFFFADIERNQTDAAGLRLLRTLATYGEEAWVKQVLLHHHPALSDLPDVGQGLEGLLQRELIESGAEGYRFQVELIRRWFGGQ